MRYVFFTEYWKNSDGGGIKNYVVNLAEALQVMGTKIDVIYRSGYDPENFKGSRNRFLFLFRSYLYLRKIRPDIVNVHQDAYSLLPCFLYKKLHGCTLIYTFHNEPYREIPFPIKPALLYFFNACDGVTFVSKRLQERFIEVQGLSFPRTAITYAGVRVGEAPDDEKVERFREQYGIDKNSVVLLAQGMTAYCYKVEGLKKLILAVRILRETYPNLILIATREGQYSKDVNTFAREVGAEKQVVFTGDVENPFIPLKLCDIYTHITLGEGGLSLALLEAMAMGKPIVAAKVGGIPEVITDEVNGILVAPEVEQVAEKIDFLLRNREYAKQLGICAKKTVEENFTWKMAAERYLKVYEDFR